MSVVLGHLGFVFHQFLVEILLLLPWFICERVELACSLVLTCLYAVICLKQG